jgi:zona occludens toxin
MISLITGVPGSGKTAFAVKQITDSFFTEDSKYKVLYTNIAHFDYDLFRAKIPPKNRKDIKSFDLNFELFHKHLDILYEMYKDPKKDESDLIEYVSSNKLKDSLIVIDEAHNYFGGRDDDILIWFLTYHRHLFMDIMLLTQNMSLINKKYLGVIEMYYVGQRRANAITSSLKYFVYTSSFFIKENQVDTISLKPSKDIFDLYHSGDSVKVKSYSKKFIMYAIAAFVVLGFSLFYSFKVVILDKIDAGSKKVEDTKKVLSPKSNSNTNISITSNIPISSSNTYYIRCMNKDKRHDCYLKDYDVEFYSSKHVFNSFKKRGIQYAYSRYITNSNGIFMYEYEYLLPDIFLKENFPRWYDMVQEKMKEEEKVSTKPEESLSLSDALTSALKGSPGRAAAPEAAR